MKLINAVLRPAIVLEHLGNGLIKAEVPGLFSEQDLDKLPPIMPFFGNHSNTYSEPKQYDEIWVLNCEDNPMQLFWFRKDDHTKINQELEQGTNVEILCNREVNNGLATIYFSDGTGWLFRNGNSFININADGSILLNPNLLNRTIHLCPNSISLGKENGSTHPAAYGDSIQDCLEDIASCLEIVQQASSMNPYTIPISAAIGATPSKLKTKIATIVSPNVSLE